MSIKLDYVCSVPINGTLKCEALMPRETKLIFKEPPGLTHCSITGFFT